MKAKLPHVFSEATAINCNFCHGSGKAQSLGLGAGVIDLCHHCNGLGKTDKEQGAYHVDIVIQQLQSVIKNQENSIVYLRSMVKFRDPRCEDYGVGQFGATRSD